MAVIGALFYLNRRTYYLFLCCKKKKQDFLTELFKIYLIKRYFLVVEYTFDTDLRKDEK